MKGQITQHSQKLPGRASGGIPGRTNFSRKDRLVALLELPWGAPKCTPGAPKECFKRPLGTASGCIRNSIILTRNHTYGTQRVFKKRRKVAKKTKKGMTKMQQKTRQFEHKVVQKSFRGPSDYHGKLRQTTNKCTKRRNTKQKKSKQNKQKNIKNTWKK